MTCNQAREMLSARIDGELAAADESSLEAHIETCAACTSFQEDAYALGRVLHLRAVDTQAAERQRKEPATVDLVGSMRALSLLRVSLFVIGGTLVLLNVSSVVAPGAGPAAHLGRHDGVFGTALGVGMLAVAARPHRAIGLVPLTSALAVLMTAAAAADLLAGNATLLSEAIHVVEFSGLLCLWVISGGPSRIPRHVAAIAAWLPSTAPNPQLAPIRSQPESR